MLDDSECFIRHPALVRLLAYYVRAGVASPEAWQHRLDQLESAETEDLAKLHGWLLAHGWLEPNLGAVPCSYRATPAGRRALRQSEAGRLTDNADAEAA